MAEDRHTFSEPRPIPGLQLPTWDVDVFRDGVPEPILTLRIDKNSLPPRKSKKKKVVWRLPDTIEQIPRFGIDEKRRLLDLFKNSKKERRKSKQKCESGTSIDLMTVDGTKSDDDIYEPDSKNTQENLDTAMTAMKDILLCPVTPTVNESHLAANGKHSVTSIAAAPLPPPPGLSVREMPTSIPPGIHPKPMNGGSVSCDHEPNLPPGITRPYSPNGHSSSSPPPPPGLIPITPPHSQSHYPIEAPTLLNHQDLSDRQQPPQRTPQPGPEPAPLPGPTPLPIAPPPTRRRMKYLLGMHPDTFAQQVANLYTTLLQSGQVDELLMYYTLTAQKSLSLKSAKSICHTPSEMKTQLNSLVGCVFAVQGITVQQSVNSLLLIWSGLCQLQGQQPNGFCQAIVLVPIMTGADEESGLQYQIQNDALVLITNE